MALAKVVRKMEEDLRNIRRDVDVKKRLIFEKKQFLGRKKEKITSLKEEVEAARKTHQEHVATVAILEENISGRKIDIANSAARSAQKKQENQVFLADLLQKKTAIDAATKAMEVSVSAKVKGYHSLPKSRELADLEAERARLRNLKKVLLMKDVTIPAPPKPEAPEIPKPSIRVEMPPPQLPVVASPTPKPLPEVLERIEIDQDEVAPIPKETSKQPQTPSQSSKAVVQEPSNTSNSTFGNSGGAARQRKDVDSKKMPQTKEPAIPTTARPVPIVVTPKRSVRIEMPPPPQPVASAPPVKDQSDVWGHFGQDDAQTSKGGHGGFFGTNSPTHSEHSDSDGFGGGFGGFGGFESQKKDKSGGGGGGFGDLLF